MCHKLILTNDPKDETVTTQLTVRSIRVRTFSCDAASVTSGIINFMLKRFWISINLIFRAILSIPVIPIKKIFQVTTSMCSF